MASGGSFAECKPVSDVRDSGARAPGKNIGSPSSDIAAVSVCATDTSSVEVPDCHHTLGFNGRHSRHGSREGLRHSSRVSSYNPLWHSSDRVDLYLEERTREQAARLKQDAEVDGLQAQKESTGNGSMNLGNREGAGGEEEEEWEEEYVMLDLDDVFHGAPIRNSTYTLTGLDTMNPKLTLDNGVEMIGHYVETIGTVVVYSEKEGAAQADGSAVPQPPAPIAVNTEKKSLKRIRGVCMLERKLKFRYMPTQCPPPRPSMPTPMGTGDTSLCSSRPTVEAPGGIFMPTPHTLPTENASVVEVGATENAALEAAKVVENAAREDARRADVASSENVRQTEDITLENCRPTNDACARPKEDGAQENAMSTQGALLQNPVPRENPSEENPNPTQDTEDASLDNARPMEDISLENFRPTEDACLENAKRMEDAALQNARPKEDSPLETTKPTEDTSSK